MVGTKVDAEFAVLENKQAIREFYDLAFKQRRPNDAAARCLVAPSFSFSHPSGLASPQAYMASVLGWIDTLPHLTVEVVRLVCEGEHVLVHSHFVPAPGLPGMLVMDLFRMRDGKIAEHWDAIQQVGDTSFRPRLD